MKFSHVVKLMSSIIAVEDLTLLTSDQSTYYNVLIVYKLSWMKIHRKGDKKL